MGKTINDLIGAKVQDFLKVHDYAQVITDLAGINIFNPFKCLIKNEDISVNIQGKELINSAITRMEIKRTSIYELCLMMKKSLKFHYQQRTIVGRRLLIYILIPVRLS